MENNTKIFVQIKNSIKEVYREEIKLENISWKKIDNVMTLYIKDFRVDEEIIKKHFGIGYTITFAILVTTDKGEMYEAGRATDIMTEDYHSKYIDIDWTLDNK